jgi:3-isopropylmalate/(R)-2-methylmalate dehydratase large subunit
MNERVLALAAMGSEAETARTIFEKIWSTRKITENDQGESLIYIDRHLLNETSFICFQELERKGRSIRRPAQTFLATDHTVLTRERGIVDYESRNAIAWLERYSEANDVMFIGPDHAQQGIGHVVAGELGLAMPGIVIAGDDSHTTTNGAFGALSLGIGFSDVGHVLATQTLWQSPFKTLQVDFDGQLSPAVDAKDLVLTLINRISAAGAIGHFVEFSGTCIQSLSMAQRMTICNMAVEAGARAAIIAPDEVTFAYLKGRRYMPEGAEWDQAVAAWRQLASDPDACFDRRVRIDAAQIAPTVTWGTSPQDAIAVDSSVPAPGSFDDPLSHSRAEASLAYMGLDAGMPVTDIRIDMVFIGSCTNGRLDDIRLAAKVAQFGKAMIPAIVVPGSSEIKRQAEAEGLHEILLAAGFEWRNPGCSMCLGMNGDLVPDGQRCASTTNRNFVGRQGLSARTHLMGPAMAAAAALHGRIVDVRKLPPFVH